MALVALAYTGGRFALRWSKLTLGFVRLATWFVWLVTITLSTVVLGTLILLQFAEPELSSLPIAFVILLGLLMTALMFATKWVGRKARKYGEKCRPPEQTAETPTCRCD